MYVAYKQMRMCLLLLQGHKCAPLSQKEQTDYTLLYPTSRVLHHKMGFIHNGASSTVKVGGRRSNYLQPNRYIDSDCGVGFFFYYDHRSYVSYYSQSYRGEID